MCMPKLAELSLRPKDKDEIFVDSQSSSNMNVRHLQSLGRTSVEGCDDVLPEGHQGDWAED